VADPTVAATQIPGSRTAERPGRRGLQIILAAICCAPAITACGGASVGTTTSSGGKSGSLVSLAVCMRSHGVSDFPDPGGSGSGGGVSIIPAGIDTAAPAFKTAWSGCSRLLTQRDAHHGPSAQGIEQMRRFSVCMRSHGVSGFPDPTPTPPSGFGPGASPSSSQSGYSAVVRSGGAYLAIPDTLSLTSPTYRQAATACRFGPGFS
jgi:hypothetical protein